MTASGVYLDALLCLLYGFRGTGGLGYRSQVPVTGTVGSGNLRTNQ